jgi:hypothetical protein
MRAASAIVAILLCSPAVAQERSGQRLLVERPLPGISEQELPGGGRLIVSGPGSVVPKERPVSRGEAVAAPRSLDSRLVERAAVSVSPPDGPSGNGAGSPSKQEPARFDPLPSQDLAAEGRRIEELARRNAEIQRQVTERIAARSAAGQ